MNYFVKRIAGGNYANAELTIKLGAEEPVTEEQYKYLNLTFGTSGYFVFRTEGTAKAASVVKESTTPKKEVGKEAESADKKVAKVKKATKTK